MLPESTAAKQKAATVAEASTAKLAAVVFTRSAGTAEVLVIVHNLNSSSSHIESAHCAILLHDKIALMSAA